MRHDVEFVSFDRSRKCGNDSSVVYKPRVAERLRPLFIPLLNFDVSFVTARKRVEAAKTRERERMRESERDFLFVNFVGFLLAIGNSGIDSIPVLLASLLASFLHFSNSSSILFSNYARNSFAPVLSSFLFHRWTQRNALILSSRVVTSWHDPALWTSDASYTKLDIYVLYINFVIFDPGLRVDSDVRLKHDI